MSIYCYSFIFADKVITEDNGKKALIGVFRVFNLPVFPIPSPTWFVYVGLEQIPPGSHDFSINLVRDDATQVVWAVSGEMNIDDKSNGAIEIVLPVINCIFHKPGKHTMTFNIDGRQIAARVIDINQVTKSR